MGILEISEQLRKRTVSPVELTQHCLQRITKLNPLLNAFITVTADSAIAEARQAEQEIGQGKWRGPLHGIPVGLKDLIDTAGVKTTAASALLKDRIPTRDAEVVRKLKAAGVVILGKQNLHEFAYGGSSIISYFGEARNPWNPEHITGGSSGGSAAAVAAGLGFAAIGTDTAGSVREPAAACGIVGLKPTYGRVSVEGVIPLSISLDHVGPLTTSVADAAAVFDAIAESAPKAAPGIAGQQPISTAGTRNLRIGVPRKYFFDALDSEISAAVEDALTTFKKIVSQVSDIELDVPEDRSLQSAESYEYHAESVTKAPELYDPETLRRIRAGEKYSAGDRARAITELQQERRKIQLTFREVDVLVTPTLPVSPPRIADLKHHPEKLRPAELVLLRNTRPFNVWGLPAISIPCGFTREGLPIGLQIAGPHWSDSTVLAVARAYERVTEWHKNKPSL